MDYNLLSTISLGKKEIGVFFKMIGQLFEIYLKNEVVGLADMIDNQYVIWLAKSSVRKVNIIKKLTSEI